MPAAAHTFTLFQGVIRQKQASQGCQVCHCLIELLFLPHDAEEEQIPWQFSCLSAPKFPNHQAEPHYSPSKGKRQKQVSISNIRRIELIS